MSSDPSVLLLFDIDGTLIEPIESTTRILHEATKVVYGSAFRLSTELSFSGNTDLFNVTQYLQALGLSEQDIEQSRPTVMELFNKMSLDLIAREEIRTLPGAREIVVECRLNSRYLMGLLTGNSEIRAKAKLEKVDLARYFEVGVFGDVELDRNKLPHIAQQRIIEEHQLTFEGPDIVIIGDTPNDVTCARRFGSWAVAVATGHYSSEDLRKFGPDLLLADLTEKAPFLRFVESRGCSQGERV